MIPNRSTLRLLLMVSLTGCGAGEAPVAVVLLARAELPDGLDPLEIGPDYVIGLRRDELDVELVEVYALRRGDAR